MKANQLLVSGLKKLAACMLAGLFGFVAMKSYHNINPTLVFDVDESIVGESFIDEFNRIVTVSATDDMAKTEFTTIINDDVYTRDVLKESGMNSIDAMLVENEFYTATCLTQTVVNLIVFRPPRLKLARSDLINTS